ncbi:MAG: helix-turn-helix domain-containing protein, partial [Candidatus Kapaibacterium sp.]
RQNSVNSHLPPLRQHTEDIEHLVELFAQRAADKSIVAYSGIDPAALQLLQQQPWPGNVRELRNIIETMVTLEQGARITEEMVLRYLPQELQDPSPTPMALMSLPTPNQRAQEFDVQMLYRTLLQLSTDVAEVKTILRHLLSMSVPHEPQLPTAPTIAPSYEPSADPLEIRPRGSAQAPSSSPDQLDLATLERQAIETALRRTQGNRRDAAKMLGISERTLYRKIDEYGLI